MQPGCWQVEDATLGALPPATAAAMGALTVAASPAGVVVPPSPGMPHTSQ
ncbi:hypothetical protein [Nocardioides humi]|nr:hypothetical protein [Nocardioides humi]